MIELACTHRCIGNVPVTHLTQPADTVVVVGGDTNYLIRSEAEVSSEPSSQTERKLLPSPVTRSECMDNLKARWLRSYACTLAHVDVKTDST